MLLMSEGIPETCADVVEFRAARISFPDEVRSLRSVDREMKALRHARKAELQAGAEFVEVRPVLPLQVNRRVRVPVELHLKGSERWKRVAEAGLDVPEDIMLEPTEIDRVIIHFEEQPSAFAAEGVAEAASEGNASAIIGRHETDVFTFAVSDALSGL